MNTAAKFVQRVTTPDAAVMAQLDNPDDTTTRILRAAREQFESSGIRRSTMEDVARRAGLGRATLYRRFANKDQLIDAVVLAEVQRFYAGYGPARARGATFAERNAEATAYTVRFLREHALLNRLMDTEPDALLPHLASRGVVEFISQQGAAVLLAELYPQSAPTPAQRQHVDIVSELNARLVLSFISTPESVIDLDSDDAARRFARDYLIPMFAGWPGGNLPA